MGDTFTGGKREINALGGDYYETVESLYPAPPTGVAPGVIFRHMRRGTKRRREAEA